MRACGIVCELNPPHKGHERLVRINKEKYDAIVGVLSGPIVQRGSFAILDKWYRAKLALHAGFDLIIELPQIYVLQSAEQFAFGAIKVLAQIPDICALAFGVESKEALETLLKKDSPEVQSALRTHIQKGLSYRSAHEKALDITLSPNAILACEYVRAINALSLSWDINVTSRPDNYHSKHDDSSFPSATKLRQMLPDNPVGASKHLVMDNSEEYFATIESSSVNTSSIFPYLKLRAKLDPLPYFLSPHFEPGMENRLNNALFASSSLEEALQKAANKRQSISRYRRMILTSILGIFEDIANAPAPYVRPLAFNEKGRKLLSTVQAPVVQKITQRNLSSEQDFIFQIDRKAQTLYELLTARNESMDHSSQMYYGQ